MHNGSHWHRAPHFFSGRTTLIYKFKSKAAGDLIMLEPNGRQVLEIIGKHAGPQGIILPEEMEPAIEQLQRAVERAESAPAPKAPASERDGDAATGERDVTLRQRAVPFIDMLRACKAAGKEIVWGV